MSPQQERDVEIALAELRCRRLELSLELAHVDWLGLLIRDGLAAPWAVRAWLARDPADAAAKEPAE